MVRRKGRLEHRRLARRSQLRAEHPRPRISIVAGRLLGYYKRDTYVRMMLPALKAGAAVSAVVARQRPHSAEASPAERAVGALRWIPQ